MTDAPHLPQPVLGQRHSCNRRAGPITYYVKGSGTPVLLIHSINAAASAYEVRPIWDAAPAGWCVYALDLPGFGHSDRSDRLYDRDLYVDAILDMLDEIAHRHGSAPVNALALSLSCEFLARATLRARSRLSSLVLVTPTGFQKGASKLTGPAGATREIPGVHRIVSLPLLRDGLWRALVSRVSIRYFLEKTYGSKEIDESLLAYDDLTAHQPGARYAPFAFVSGRLFSADIRRVYEALDLPIWMPHATKGDFADFSEAAWVDARPNWTRHPFPTGALVHFEQRQAFMAELEQFGTFSPSPAPGAA